MSETTRTPAADIVAAIAVDAGRTLGTPPNTTHAQAYYRATIATIRKALEDGNSVALQGLGSFHPAQYGPRTGRDLRTGEPIKVGPRKGVRFRLSTPFRDVLNGKKGDGK